MAARAKKRPSRAMSPEMKKAYTQVEAGVRGIGKSMVDIQHGLQQAERKVRTDARSRVRTLRTDTYTQLATLRARRRDATRALQRLATAAEASWRDVKHSADTILADARATARSVTKRFRKALAS